MKGLVPLENMNNKKTRNILVAIFSSLVLLAILYCAIMSVRAYFTASSTRSGEISFGSVEITLTESDDSELSIAEFETRYLSDLAPGQTINFENLKVNNVGTADAYVLLNLEVVIDALSNNYDLIYSKWYNLSAEEVKSLDFANNTTKPTIIASGESATTNLSYTVSGTIVDNKYSEANLTARLTAYAVQTRLPDEEYVDGDLYASYFIISQASNFGNFKTEEIYYGEPLKIGETAPEELNVELTPLGDNGKCSLSASEIGKLKDKKFVVSTLVKNFEDDNSTINGTRKGYMISMEYVYSGGSIKKSSQFGYAGGETYNNKWVHNWISNERILAEISDENLATVNEINIYLADYNTATNRNYDVKDYVLELGVSPTEQPISPDIVKTRMTYEQLKTAKQISLTKPSYSEVIEGLYCSVFNFELTNVYEQFELVASTSGEAVFLLDGHYDLETLVSLYLSESLPEPETGYLSASEVIPANTNLKFCVAIVSSTNVDHSVNLAKFEREGNEVNKISYETLKSGKTIIPTNISDKLDNGYNTYIKLYNFEITDITEDNLVDVVAKGGGTLFMANDNGELESLLGNMPEDATSSESGLLTRQFNLTAGETCKFMVGYIGSTDGDIPYIQVGIHKEMVYELNDNQLITQKKIDYSYSTHTPSEMGISKVYDSDVPFALYYFEIKNAEQDFLLTIDANTWGGFLLPGKAPLNGIGEYVLNVGVFDKIEVKQGDSQLFTVVYMAYNLNDFQALEFSIQTIEKIEVDYSTLSAQPTVFNTSSAEYGNWGMYNFVISNIDENADIVVTVTSVESNARMFIMPGFCGYSVVSGYLMDGNMSLPEGTESDGEATFTLTAGEVFEFSVMSKQYPCEIQISIKSN